MTRVEIFWPQEPEHEGSVGLRQVAWAEGIGEYVQKTLYVPLEAAAALGASLAAAGRSAPEHARPLARGRARRAGQGRLRLVTTARG